MKRSICRLTAAALLLAAVCLSRAGQVRADVIYEPDGNDFFSRHRSEMTREDHTFEVRAPGEGTPVYESPVSAAREGELNNGTRVQGSFAYTGSDGVKWIIIDRFNNGASLEGWVPADHLWRVYDSEMFSTDYADRIENKEGVLRVPSGKRVCLYRYPGCPDGQPVLTGESEEREILYYGVFTEEDGTRWGRVGYYIGYRGYWINLDRPDKLPEELYPNGCPVYDRRGLPEPLPEPIVPKPDRTLLYAGTGVAAAALIAAAILLILKKKHSSDPETK